jgi:aspartyl-tRNA(Asn)/glutamyl-tRNA(Gln) amidotransferase subunit C
VIDEKMLRYIAELAKIEIDEENNESLADELERIVEYMGILKNIDLEGVCEMSHPFPEKQLLREDVCLPTMTPEALLSNAPEQMDGYYIVPKTLE